MVTLGHKLLLHSRSVPRRNEAFWRSTCCKMQEFVLFSKALEPARRSMPSDVTACFLFFSHKLPGISPRVFHDMRWHLCRTACLR